MYAEPSDVAARWPGYNAEEHEALATTKIVDAEALLLDKIPSLPQRIANGVVSERTVVKVVCDMVIRALRSPDGFRSEHDGDYQYEYAPGAESGGTVQFTRADAAELRGNRNGTTMGPGDDDALEHLFRRDYRSWDETP